MGANTRDSRPETIRIRAGHAGKHVNLKRMARKVIHDRYLLLIICPLIVYYIIFQYIPMYGIIIAFKNFTPLKGILGSPWAGMKWFEQFVNSLYFWRLLKNTLLLGIYTILWAFPVPIVFALLLNELRDGVYKRIVQSISYMPYFISTVVVVGMMVNFLSPTDGVVNMLLRAIGLQGINFMNDPKWFRTLYIGSTVWQTSGWSSIIYLAAMSNIDQELYDAAKIDGAGKLKRIINVTIPGIAPTIIILLILNLGNVMSVGFEKILLMYSPVTYEVSDVIQTYVYRRGIYEADYSFGAAVGLFNSVCNCILLFIANRVSKKVSDIGLW